MGDKIAILRREIALLRGYLREGVDADIGQTHLREIAQAEAELRDTEDHEQGS